MIMRKKKKMKQEQPKAEQPEEINNNNQPNEQTAETQESTSEKQEEVSETPSEPTPELTPEEKLQKELDELQVKFANLNDTYLRSRAEFDNYRKRTLAEKAELIKNGGEKVLVNILPVIDDFERGLEAVGKAEDVAGVKEGMELVYNKMQNFLKQNGITVMETEGKAFDTDQHEAITMIPAPTEELKGKVVDCIQKGYYLNDKVIRYAKVVVGN